MLPMFSLDVSFLLLFILLCISYLRTGTAFKISLTGANSVPADFFSKGTLTHQIAPVKHKIYKHKEWKGSNISKCPKQILWWIKGQSENINVWFLIMVLISNLAPSINKYITGPCSVILPPQRINLQTNMLNDIRWENKEKKMLCKS